MSNRAHKISEAQEHIATLSEQIRVLSTENHKLKKEEKIGFIPPVLENPALVNSENSEHVPKIQSSP